MTSQWTPARAGQHRDLFSAFVCDDASGDQLRATCLELGWPIDKIHKGGLQNAVQTLSVSASPSILFVDLSETKDPLRDINALAEVCEPGTIVISGGLVNDVRLYRDLLASGLQDYLLKPFTPEQLRDAFAHAHSILHAPRPEDVSERPQVSVCVIGARGGCGASTVAAALAWSIAMRERLTTAILDLDVHFGTGSLSLDLEPGRGLMDAIENPSRIDGLFLERAIVKVTQNLSILSAEASISEPVISDGKGYRLLQEEVKSAFECTIVDAPRNLLIYHPSLIFDASQVVIVAELTLACARDVFRLTSWLKKEAPQSRVIVALNKVPSGSSAEISRRDFESAIEAKVAFVLPEDSRTARNASKLGKALTDSGKGSRLASAINAMAADIVSVSAGAKADPVARTSGTSLMGKLAELGSRLPGVGKMALDRAER